jgi:heat-inducible transcriptional repressor
LAAKLCERTPERHSEQRSERACGEPELSARQGAVLRAIVQAYVGEAAPIGSQTLAHLLPMSISPASVRATLGELAGMGLVEKPHTSSGRIPTERGLRLFVDRLLDPTRLDASNVGSYEMRAISHSVDEAEPDSVVHIASQLLSECTRQLGFVVAPRLERIVLRRISLVRLSSERVLVVLVASSGAVHRRVITGDRDWEQRELDRCAELLSQRAAGRSLLEVRAALVDEAARLRERAGELLVRAIELGRRALAAGGDDVDLVIETRLALLDQPEFRDPQRVRDLFGALETKQRLLEVLDGMLESDGVCVVFGDEIEEPGLRHCALVASRYGGSEAPLGTLGVIGPVRMDYGRVIPLVDFLSQTITGRLLA